jgi:hypothetical protein
MAGTTASSVVVALWLMVLLQAVNSQSCSREEYNNMQQDFTNCTGNNITSPNQCCQLLANFFGQIRQKKKSALKKIDQLWVSRGFSTIVNGCVNLNLSVPSYSFCRSSNCYGEKLNYTTNLALSGLLFHTSDKNSAPNFEGHTVFLCMYVL